MIDRFQHSQSGSRDAGWCSRLLFISVTPCFLSVMRRACIAGTKTPLSWWVGWGILGIYISPSPQGRRNTRGGVEEPVLYSRNFIKRIPRVQYRTRADMKPVPLAAVSSFILLGTANAYSGDMTYYAPGKPSFHTRPHPPTLSPTLPNPP